MLDSKNVSSIRELASYTPGLAVNNRYGADNTTFTIRGFYQEQRSFATVGVFFADVVAPRGSGATFGGDGAGPGALFDLQNVQVLKGPQGTLFGRNVTGGAVLLVPQKPKDKFEGYVEGGLGNYDMKRLQAVINVPLGDNMRARLGFDHMDRLGYLKNGGNFGDGSVGKHRGLGDVNYWAGRASLVWDVTPDIENYTIGTYTHSQSNGVIPKVIKAYPCSGTATPPCPASSNQAFFGNESVAQIAREAPLGFWSVSNRLPDSHAISEQWQVINTLTWTASESLKVKNILSYGEFRGTTNLDLFGNYSLLPGVVYGAETGLQVRGFAFTHDNSDTGRTNSQSSFVAELQFQGTPADGRFTWQAGGYLEMNDPIGFSGVQTASFTGCTDVASYSCLPASALGGPTFPAGTGAGTISGGTGSYSVQKTKFRDYAFYAQGSYKLTDQFTLTGGVRYTWDKMRTLLINETVVFTPNIANLKFGCSNFKTPGPNFVPVVNVAVPSTYPYPFSERLNRCQQNLEKNTKAPTWLIQADYKPIEEVMLYAKWTRGYRQGGLAIFGPDPIQPYDKEKVDTYEIGAKASWRGAVPGSFNISGYRSDLSNQQLQLGVSCNPNFPNFTVICSGNATIINAGKSRIQGFEAELNVSPFQGLQLNAAYGYIDAKLLSFVLPTVPPPFNVITPPLAKGCTGPQCDVIANSGPPHQLVLGGNYTLPLPQALGKFTVGGTWVYQSRRRIVADGVPGSGNGIAPSSRVLNLNATLENLGGYPVDVSGFVTNVTNEHVILQINENQIRGFVSAIVGEPRMWGVRVKYRFGQ
jgi:iron complex outermembrane receptor protein